MATSLSEPATRPAGAATGSGADKTAARPVRRGPSAGARRGVPVGRHVAAAGLLGVVALLFARVHGDMAPLHRWNRSAADTAIVSLCLILALGPAARFVAPVRRLLPWRRELGLGFFVALGLHVAIYVHGAYDWDVLGFFVVDEPGSRTLARSGTAAANWVGLFALGYAAVLTVTSNRLAQSGLGRGWKFLQQQAYTLFVLAVLHAAGWMYLVRRPASGFRSVFWAAVSVTVALQGAGFVRTILSSKGRAARRIPTGVRAGVAGG